MKIDSKRVKIVIGIELFIAIIIFIGVDWAGEEVRNLFRSYFVDIALPFGFYYLLILNEEKFTFLRKWYVKAVAVFLLVSVSEILQYFGIYALAVVFDPVDFVMYAGGVLLAALADIKFLSRLYPAMHLTKKL
jgi:hypothetical protein